MIIAGYKTYINRTKNPSSVPIAVALGRKDEKSAESLETQCGNYVTYLNAIIVVEEEAEAQGLKLVICLR
jgi:hypothetical protein